MCVRTHARARARARTHTFVRACVWVRTCGAFVRVRACVRVLETLKLILFPFLSFSLLFFPRQVLSTTGVVPKQNKNKILVTLTA